MSALIMDGSVHSKKIIEDLKKEVISNSYNAHLVAISVGKNDLSKIYLERKKEIANKIGIRFTNLHFEKINDKELISEIEKLNFDGDVSGIMIQLPLPPVNNFYELSKRVLAWKDVEGINPYNKGLLDNNDTSLIPPTSAAIISLFSTYSIPLVGANVVIIGSGEVVGKPLVKTLLNTQSTIISCNEYTDDLVKFTLLADIIISAVGESNLLKPDMIKKDCVLVNVGIEKKNGNISGDFDVDEMKNKASYIVPPISGVGPMVIAFLMLNTIICHKYSLLKSKDE